VAVDENLTKRDRNVFWSISVMYGHGKIFSVMPILQAFP